MCEYCKSGTTTDLPVNSKAYIPRFIALIADMGNGPEICVSNKGIMYGIPITYCPKCGDKITR